MLKTKIIVALTTSILTLFIIFIYRAYIINQPCEHDIKPLKESDKLLLNDQLLNRFKTSLKFKTVSFDKNNQNETALNDYVNFIRKEYNEIENYPFVNLNIINKYSLLYKINGKNTNLKPYLLAAHFDVVPALNEENKWKYDPFEAEIENDYIYGRGTLDNKSSMLSQLEALKIYLKKHSQPERSLYLAYGHDEEISGHNGAELMSKFLGNISLEYVLDEGPMIVEDIFPAVNKPIALIGVAEKGFLTVKFSVSTTGGHSSMPDDNESATFIIADAISRLKRYKSPSYLGYGPEKDLIEKIAVNLGFLKRIILSNIWFFKPIIELIFSKTPSTDAILRTTTSVTIVNSGLKENVIPSYAEFVVNHRIHNSQTVAQVLEYDLKIIANPRIKYEILSYSEPSKISPMQSLGYTLIEHTSMQIFPDIATAPGVMVGLSDSRFYENLTQNIYRYLPIKLKNQDLKRYHGIDERISLNNYKDLINFYYLLIKNTDKAHLEELNKSKIEL